MNSLGMKPKIPLVDLKRQYHSIKAEIDQKIVEVIESGQFIAGENVRAFEKEFASYCGTRYAIAVASGTDALLLCIRALGIGSEDEVITVPNTFISTVDSISRNSARPVFVDVLPDDGNINVENVKRAITPKTRAVIPVHLYGNPVHISSLLEIMKDNEVSLIEDACQAHGTEYRGRRAGSFGRCSAFSFYPAKNLGAYGDAGMIVTNDGELDARFRMLRNYGEKSKYYSSLIGFNTRLDELQAAVLRVKLRYLDRWVRARRKIAELYQDLLQDIKGIGLLREEPDGKSSYYCYAVRSTNRDKLRAWLGSRGISTGIHYPIPIHLQQAYSYLLYKRGTFSVAEKWADQILSLPMYPELTEEEVQYISSSIAEFSSNQ